ncbi:MAG: hypothetical protein WC723_07120, partial [Candidatus Omnitrophota bacterium]
ISHKGAEDEGRSYTYDSGVGLSVITYAKEYKKSEEIIEILQDLWRENKGKGLFNAYNIFSTLPAETQAGAGPNAYILSGVADYIYGTKDTRHLSFAIEIGDYLLSLQDNDPTHKNSYGAFRMNPASRYFSTEENISTRAALRKLYQVLKIYNPEAADKYKDAYGKTEAWLTKAVWPGAQYFYVGYDEASGKWTEKMASDIGFLIINSFNDEELKQLFGMTKEVIKETEDKYFKVTVWVEGIGYVTGYDFTDAKGRQAAGREEMISVEWTLLSQDPYYIQEMEKLKNKDGFLPYATLEGAETGFGWKTPVRKVKDAPVYSLISYFMDNLAINKENLHTLERESESFKTDLEFIKKFKAISDQSPEAFKKLAKKFEEAYNFEGLLKPRSTEDKALLNELLKLFKKGKDYLDLSDGLQGTDYAILGEPTYGILYSKEGPRDVKGSIEDFLFVGRKLRDIKSGSYKLYLEAIRKNIRNYAKGADILNLSYVNIGSLIDLFYSPSGHLAITWALNDVKAWGLVIQELEGMKQRKEFSIWQADAKTEYQALITKLQLAPEAPAEEKASKAVEWANNLVSQGKAQEVHDNYALNDLATALLHEVKANDASDNHDKALQAANEIYYNYPIGLTYDGKGSFWSPLVALQNDFPELYKELTARYIDETIKNNPESIINQAASLMGNLNYGDYEKAREFLQKVLKVYPENKRAQELFNDVDGRIKRYEDKLKEAELKKLVLQANKLMQDGEYAGAIQSFEQALKLAEELQKNSLVSEIKEKIDNCQKELEKDTPIGRIQFSYDQIKDTGKFDADDYSKAIKQLNDLKPELAKITQAENKQKKEDLLNKIDSLLADYPVKLQKKLLEEKLAKEKQKKEAAQKAEAEKVAPQPQTVTPVPVVKVEATKPEILSQEKENLVKINKILQEVKDSQKAQDPNLPLEEQVKNLKAATEKLGPCQKELLLVGSPENAAEKRQLTTAFNDYLKYLSDRQQNKERILKEQPQSKPEPKPVVKVEPKVEVKVAPQMEVKVAPKVEAAKVEIKVEAKKPEPVAVVPAPVVKVEPAVKVAPKVEVKAEPKVEVKVVPAAVIKPETKKAEAPKPLTAAEEEKLLLGKIQASFEQISLAGKANINDYKDAVTSLKKLLSDLDKVTLKEKEVLVIEINTTIARYQKKLEPKKETPKPVVVAPAPVVKAEPKVEVKVVPAPVIKPETKKAEAPKPLTAAEEEKLLLGKIQASFEQISLAGKANINDYKDAVTSLKKLLSDLDKVTLKEKEVLVIEINTTIARYQKKLEPKKETPKPVVVAPAPVVKAEPKVEVKVVPAAVIKPETKKAEAPKPLTAAEEEKLLLGKIQASFEQISLAGKANINDYKDAVTSLKKLLSDLDKVTLKEKEVLVIEINTTIARYQKKLEPKKETPKPVVVAPAPVVKAEPKVEVKVVPAPVIKPETKKAEAPKPLTAAEEEKLLLGKIQASFEQISLAGKA